MNELKERQATAEKAGKAVKLPRIYTRVFNRPRLVAFLKIFDKSAVILTAVAYLAALIWCAVKDPPSLVGLLVSTAIPFAGISLFRKLFNAPRPYELYDLSEFIDSAGLKRGSSFPSRHVASAFLIGSSLCFVNPIAGVAVLALAVGMGACRVFLAKHFLRDVIAGAAMGGILGAAGMLIVGLAFSA